MGQLTNFTVGTHMNISYAYPAVGPNSNTFTALAIEMSIAFILRRGRREGMVRRLSF